MQNHARRPLPNPATPHGYVEETFGTVLLGTFGFEALLALDNCGIDRRIAITSSASDWEISILIAATIETRHPRIVIRAKRFIVIWK